MGRAMRVTVMKMRCCLLRPRRVLDGLQTPCQELHLTSRDALPATHTLSMTYSAVSAAASEHHQPDLTISSETFADASLYPKSTDVPEAVVVAPEPHHPNLTILTVTKKHCLLVLRLRKSRRLFDRGVLTTPVCRSSERQGKIHVPCSIDFRRRKTMQPTMTKTSASNTKPHESVAELAAAVHLSQQQQQQKKPDHKNVTGLEGSLPQLLQQLLQQQLMLMVSPRMIRRLIRLLRALPRGIVERRLHFDKHNNGGISSETLLSRNISLAMKLRLWSRRPPHRGDPGNAKRRVEARRTSHDRHERGGMQCL